MQQKLKKLLILLTGWAFIVLGIIGLFLPILQGVLFLLIGLAILSTEYAWAHAWLQKLQARFPKLSSRLHAATTRVHHWLNRFGLRTQPSKQDADQCGDSADSL